MAEKSLQARIQNKCDTTANWAKATNFVPKKGEIIVYSDGGGTGVPKMKVGDGTTVVESLKFITATVPDASDTVSGIVNTGEQTFDGNKTFRGIFRVVNGNHGTSAIALGSADSSTNYLYLDRSELSFGKINASSGSTGASLKFSLHTIECYGSFVSYDSSSLGKADRPWPKAYITNLIGNADTATSASTVNGHTVNSDVPADAKFTDTVYSLPIASSSTLGGVKIGSGLTVAEDGTISAAAAYTLPTASTSTKGGIKVGTGLTMSSETLNHSNSVTAKTAYGSTATTASANGGKIILTDIKYDAQGHITGSTDRTITLSQTTYTLAGLMGSTAKGSATQPVYWNGSAWTNTTHTLGKSVPADAKFTDTVYTLPTASSTLGGVKTTSTVSATTGLTACPIIDGVVYYKDTNNTYTLAGLVGSTAIGTATNPIYWDGSKFVKTTYTLGKSVPADAKFTDTVYSLPAATTTTLGGIIAGSGLSITTEGKLSVSKVPNALSINGKSFDGSAAIDVGVIGAAYGGSGKTTLSASANAFLNSLPYGSTSETTLTDDHSFYMNGLTGQTNYKVPMSSVYTYVKGKLDSVYLPLSGGTMTGALGIGENMSITEVDTSTKHSLVFYPTAVGSNDGNKRVAFVYDPTSGELRVMAPKFQGQFIGTASQASKVINALTINGTSYNGSTAVDLTIGGGATITLKTWTDADVA